MAEIIIALDVESGEDALGLVHRLGDAVDFYKVGSPLFTRAGPDFVRKIRELGKRVFLDLKYHDIPSTVARAVRAAAALDVELLTLHTAGGESMMRAARDAAGDDGPHLLGVTILTSFSAVDVEQTWGRSIGSVRAEVTRLAALAAGAGLHGVVASPLEVETLKRIHGARLLVVTPGIRPAGERRGDQTRTATPAEAARAGSDFLVIGRPVRDASDPAAVVAAVRAELEAVREEVA